MARYSFYKTKNKVICVSSYAGKTIRGIAKCSPDDTFDEEKGERLARLRCDLKVAAARMVNAEAKMNEAADAMDKAEDRYDKMCAYFEDASREWDDLWDELCEFQGSL